MNGINWIREVCHVQSNLEKEETRPTSQSTYYIKILHQNNNLLYQNNRNSATNCLHKEQDRGLADTPGTEEQHLHSHVPCSSYWPFEQVAPKQKTLPRTGKNLLRTCPQLQIQPDQYLSGTSQREPRRNSRKLFLWPFARPNNVQ